MKGQWIRAVKLGDQTAIGIIDIDDRGDHYEGSATLFYGHDLPTLVIRLFRTRDKVGPHTMTNLPVAWHIGGDGRRELSSEEITRDFPQWAAFAKRVDLTLEMRGEDLYVAWRSDVDINGEILVSPTASTAPSVLAPEIEVQTWQDFKRFAVSQREGVLFRGQADARWRLRTHFHRAGRANLIRYQDVDVPDMHRLLSLHTRHYFKMNDDTEYGAFLHLLQHNGFPTPLLDWTGSPFVAAYFAYADRPSTGLREPTSAVRVYAFDFERWAAQHLRARGFSHTGPHLSGLSAVAIENPRSTPQQALSTYTNVDDIETFISQSTDVGAPPMLRAVDLPLAERQTALRELALMGITAASLFPGIEGVCKASKARLFGFDA